ncbi:MAG: type III-B CRISPR module RAMP protein Cmr6 [Rhodospirillales bacterium]|nr:type III-B CRISPR module RAMP protein Cmr6 [Rhodospirillales bacterium]
MTTDGNLTLPTRTAAVFRSVRVDLRHPGLLLDKFSPPGEQKTQKRALDAVLKCSGSDAFLQQLRARRGETLAQFSARSWTAETTAPMTLHLSRASALENAGICLHPLYGFVYLPGSGLKGMAHAYAETVWLASKPIEHQAAAQADIERVFGLAPKGKEGGAAGSVIFHDAWPETWPSLIVDIVNNHHKKYYRSEDAPGDWEDPEPSYFLAVPAGTSFSFALSPRREQEDDFALARKWLTGALCHLGAGAKTAAGYGGFRLHREPAPTAPKEVVGDEEKWTEWNTPLELVTPAFLAGANQEEGDCDLRPATLRGLLRWWWRTMHAAYVDSHTLQALEATVWGNTKAGSPVRIIVEPLAKPRAEAYGKSSIAKAAHLPEPKQPKTTQGLSYISYGMDETVKEPNAEGREEKKRKQRYFLPPVAKWTLRLFARSSRFPADAKQQKKHLIIPADIILEQAKAALWLLCHCGGIGSRSRKGFGSFSEINGFCIQSCQAAAERLRAACGKGGRDARAPEDVETPSLETRLSFEDGNLGTTDPWNAADKLGTALQSFVKSLPKEDRKALGLPRAEATSRHAAPMHFHVFGGKNQLLNLRVTAFTTRIHDLNLQKCRDVLTKLMEYLSQLFPSAVPIKSVVRYAKGDRVIIIETREIVTVSNDAKIGHLRMDITYDDGEPGNVAVNSCEPIE